MASKFPIDSAVVSWQDSAGVHIRVYWSDGYTVRERCCDPDSGWTDGAFSQAGADVSATSWQADGGVSIRVYCTFEDQSTEWCVDSGSADWYQGAFTLG